MKSLLVLVVLSQPVLAETITSKTTALYPSDACKEVGKARDGDDPRLRCPALPGFKVAVFFSARDTHVEVSGKGSSVQFGGGLGDELEWRLADGKPFAVILDVDVQEDGDDGHAKVVARKVVIRGTNGHDFTLEVENKGGARKQARELADAEYKKSKKPKK